MSAKTSSHDYIYLSTRSHLAMDDHCYPWDAGTRLMPAPLYPVRSIYFVLMMWITTDERRSIKDSGTKLNKVSDLVIDRSNFIKHYCMDFCMMIEPQQQAGQVRKQTGGGRMRRRSERRVSDDPLHGSWINDSCMWSDIVRRGDTDRGLCPAVDIRWQKWKGGLHYTTNCHRKWTEVHEPQRDWGMWSVLSRVNPSRASAARGA
ncbi:hypothetical protein EVAR_103830_1 [Eumeta japonica]|uniref:Uncharacterized protein n=1 Tax=Eumeta variegata TaxID=151549 RepID=A0A4C1SC86_EUMVA|nr:hypothetical protein EVAR_103830_1 [Eumeta japonica]